MSGKQTVFVQISVAELLDKISILELKRRNFTDQRKLRNVSAELSELENIMSAEIEFSDTLHILFDDLRAVNESLWFLEIKIRKYISNQIFGRQFIETARAIIYTNEQRALIKKRINDHTNSYIVEEKDYSG